MSVWNASEWMLLRWFGAMNGWRGAGGANTGFGVQGSPVNCGRRVGSGMGGRVRRTSSSRSGSKQHRKYSATWSDRTELEAAAFRRLVEHLRERSDVQNIDLMELAGFCRNCLSRWYREAGDERGSS